MINIIKIQIYFYRREKVKDQYLIIIKALTDINTMKILLMKINNKKIIQMNTMIVIDIIII